MISEPTLLKLAAAFFENVPSEVEFLHAASCCERTTLLEVAPQSCGKCGTVISQYLRIYRNGVIEERVEKIGG